MKASILIFFSIFIIISCEKKDKLDEKTLSQKVKVLNLGTFHMGDTPDKHKSDFDIQSHKIQIKEICQLLAEFQPTIILVEIEPKYQNLLEKEYAKYIENPLTQTKFQNEIQLIAFEVGRLANTKKIYGIDHSMEYDYPKIHKLAEEIDAKTYLNEYQNIIHLLDSLPSDNLINKIVRLNEQQYYDALININADLLTYVNTKSNFEGADTATNFYKRNLRMFANINKIKVNDNDRIFILSGATHAAFFNMFMKRSPKYELIPISKYLK